MEISKFFKNYGLQSYKCGTGLLLGGSALLSAGSSIGASALASSSARRAQEEANNANLQATRETNDANYKMFHEAQDFTEKMWNASNQYNAPVEQVQRLREAGINPSAVLGSNGQGTMGQAGLVSSPQPIPAVAPHVEPLPAFDYSLAQQGLERSVSSYLQNQNQDLENRSKALSLSFQAENQLVDLQSKYADLSKKAVDKDLTDEHRRYFKNMADEVAEQIDILRKTKNDIIRQANYNADLVYNSAQEAKARKEYQNTINKIAEADLEFIPEKQRQFIKESNARIATSYMQARAAGTSAAAAKKQAENEYNRLLKDSQTVDGIWFSDPKQKRNYIEHKIKLMESEYNRNLRQGKSYFRQVVDTEKDFNSVMSGRKYDEYGYPIVEYP